MELLFEPSEGIIEVTESSEDDKQIIMTQFLGNMDQHILLFDTENKIPIDLTSDICDGFPTRWEVIRWVNSENIVVATDHESDRKRLGILKTSKKFIPLKEIEDRIDFELESTSAYSKDSLWTYFVENQEGYSTIHRARFQLWILKPYHFQSEGFFLQETHDLGRQH